MVVASLGSPQQTIAKGIVKGLVGEHRRIEGIQREVAGEGEA